MKRSIALLGCSWAITTQAQTVPSELLDMSIEDLLQTRVVTEASAQLQRSTNWHLSYTVQRASFGDYYEGHRHTPAQDYLWQPQQGPREVGEYLAVTPNIHQTVHVLTLRRDLSSSTSVSLQVPWIEQSTDHISVIPNWTAFTVHSEDIGDTRLGMSHQFARRGSSAWTVNAAISLPTGSINERANTPAGPSSLLPYTMQMGSGTADLSLGLSWQRSQSHVTWGVDANATLRNGRNNHDYRLGNKHGVGIWVYGNVWPHIQPGVQLAWHHTGRIRGADPNIPGPDASGLYPTAVLNPNNYGGERLDATAFVRYMPPEQPWYVDLQYMQPLQQDLNGPQMGVDHTVGLTLGYSF